MAELAANERLLPSLLDRLTDLKPEARREGRDERVMSMSVYRDAVRRDLDFLLNTVAPTLDQGLEDFPQAQSSVLNFGVRDVCSLTAGGDTEFEIERRIKRAVARFEPRIDPRTLDVHTVQLPANEGLPRLCYEIVGDLFAEPMPVQLYVRTTVDLDTAQVDVEVK